MKRSQTDSSKYYTILKDIHSKVHPAVNAPTSPSPTKEGHTIKKEESEDQTATVNGKSEPADQIFEEVCACEIIKITMPFINTLDRVKSNTRLFVHCLLQGSTT